MVRALRILVIKGLVVLLRNVCLKAMFSSHVCSTKEFSTLYET